MMHNCKGHCSGPVVARGQYDCASEEVVRFIGSKLYVKLHAKQRSESMATATRTRLRGNKASAYLAESRPEVHLPSSDFLHIFQAHIPILQV